MRTTVACLVGLALPALAEVVDVDDLGFVSRHVVDIEAPPERVYEALTAEVANWWDPAHSYSGDAANFTLGEGPCLCESLPDGGEVVHMLVVLRRPGKALRLSGGLGPLQALGVSGGMTFDLDATDAGTRLVYRYAVTGRGTRDWAAPVDRVQWGQLERLRRYVETGSPAREPETAR